ncbi:MAG: hypothetical protein ACR2GY_02745 [Phycisphaerales bacterium]
MLTRLGGFLYTGPSGVVIDQCGCVGSEKLGATSMKIAMQRRKAHLLLGTLNICLVIGLTGPSLSAQNDDDGGQVPDVPVAPADVVPADVTPPAAAVPRQDGGEAAQVPIPPLPAGVSYDIAGFELEYVRQLPTLPDLRTLLTIALPVAVNDGVVDVADEAAVTLEQLGTMPFTQVTSEGLEAIIGGLRDALARNAGLACTVAADPSQLDPGSGELRNLPASGRLTLLISYEGRVYPISGFELSYAIDSPKGAPDEAEVLNRATARLTPIEGGYVAWRPDVAAVDVSVAELTGDPPLLLSAGALQAVLEATRDALTGRGFMAVRVIPAPGQLGQGMRDSRPEGVTTFELQVALGRVAEVRTLATGDRIAKENRINHPLHESIRARSPFQPSGSASGSTLLNKHELDEYLFRMSRHPGRRVDAAIAPADDPLGIALDYIVTENKPWLAYVQLANVGTPQTGRLRYRAGFIHNQLTKNDDILRLDGITGDFDDTWALSGSYEAPLGDSESLRWKVMADISEFGASDVGFVGQGFRGKSWSVAGELVWNFYQHRELFVDAVAGVRYLNTEISNTLLALEGDQGFVLPYVGIRAERSTLTASTSAAAVLEFQPNLGIDDVELGQLGRFNPDEEWMVFKWDLAHAFYLEPVFNKAAWRDTSTPESSTLAHEIALRFRGQYAFGNRLIPQLEQVAGGLYSVRGYPESVAVGDTTIIGTVEYRFHVPQAFGISVEPGTLFNEPFRMKPQYPYGRADWDLVLRGFVDFGWTHASDKLFFEDDQTLVGAGVGIEFVFKRNMEARIDWGFALHDVDDEVNAGSNRIHFSLTFLY